MFRPVEKKVAEKKGYLCGGPAFPTARRPELLGTSGKERKGWVGWGKRYTVFSASEPEMYGRRMWGKKKNLTAGREERGGSREIYPGATKKEAGDSTRPALKNGSREGETRSHRIRGAWKDITKQERFPQREIGIEQKREERPQPPKAKNRRCVGRTKKQTPELQEF